MAKNRFDEIMEDLRRWNRWYRPDAEVVSEQAEDGLGGVNFCGYLRDESGWGAAGRSYAHAFRALGVPLALKDLSDMTSNRSGDATFDCFDAGYPFDINFICVDASQHFAFLSRVGEEFFENRYNVGAWAWELPRFPSKWFDRFAYYDEIWVGTSFIANTLAPVSPVPVVRVPPVLTPRGSGSRERGRQRLDARAEEFVYLFIFDFHSHLQRKNPLALIDAFKTAFAPTTTARLVIKCVNADSDPAGFAALSERARGHRVSVLTGYWTAQEMRDLLAACDAYVSLHRSEGTGLTISDAMAQAKPVIATGWSGNMDFMNVSNSFPVRYELIEIAENVGPYTAGETWADPSVEHAAELMRLVFSDRDAARERGLRARQDIESQFSESAVAELIGRRLEVIAGRHRFAVTKRQLRDFYSSYRQLVGRVREVARRVLPPRSTVIVISKGDEQLLELDGQQGWHFPQTPEGTYAGNYPPDSASAVAHLEALRERGAQFLLVPGTARWWLDLYAEFGQHLDANYTRAWSDDSCTIFQLSARPPVAATR